MSRMQTSAVSLPRAAWLVLVVVPLAGCASSYRSDDALARKVEEVRRESTPEALERSAMAAAAGGDPARAEQYFAAALRAGGPERRLTEKLVRLCVEDGRLPVAAHYADEYLERHPFDSAMRFVAATLKTALGDRVGALGALSRVVEDKPELAAAHYAFAKALLAEGNAGERARRHLRTYLELAPNGAFADAARAELLRTELLRAEEVAP